MSTTDWPASIVPSAVQWQLQKAGTQFTSPFNGTTQAVDYVAERWQVSLSLPAVRSAGAVAALLNNLAGGVNRVNLWHHGTGGQPAGTLRGTPTLGAAVARGASSLALVGCTAIEGTPTLLAGDMIGCGGHLLQVAADCSAVAGAMTVPLVNRVRSAIAGGAAVTWYKPTAQFIMPAMVGGTMQVPGFTQGAALDLVEVY